MGFQFAETMAGTVVWDAAFEAQAGMRHPFRFEIEARVDSTRQHLADGKAEVRGTIHAPPIAHGVDVEGVITIRPIGQRIIRYELAFVGSDGKRYELVGQKDIRWLSPLRTFTHLTAEIRNEEHRRVGACDITFDLKKDWWSFLRSFAALSPRPRPRPARHASGIVASPGA
jgi:hypothetical protein